MEKFHWSMYKGLCIKLTESSYQETILGMKLHNIQKVRQY